MLGWGPRWSRNGHPRLGETPETRPAGQSGPSSGEAVNGIKSCFSVASGTRPRAASSGHRHDVSGWRGPCQGHRPAAACLPREAARGRAAPSGQAETQGRVTDPHRPRHACLPRPHLGTTCRGPRLAQTLCIPSRAQGAHSKAPRARFPSRVFGRARASGVGRAAPCVRAKPCGVGTSSRSGPGFRSWGYLLLLVTPDVRKPGWTQQAPGGWGSGGAGRRARTPWRGSAWGRGPGKRPEVLLYCGQAQGMRGSCTGSRGDARGHSKGLRVAQQGCPQRSSRHRAERPRVGSGPSPAGDRRWQRRAPQSPSVRGPCRDVRT